MLNSILNLLPPLFVLALVGWSYYSYVFQFGIIFVDKIIKKTIYLIIYHILFTMFMWSFIQTMCKLHRAVPDEYRLSSQEHSRLLTYTEDEADEILKKIVAVRKLELYTSTPNGRIRYCKLCKLIKPDRTHHCTTCAKCILKMDHHCPWIFNCVGYCNYKQFILMLMYATIWCIFYVATVAEYLSEIWRDFQNNIGKLVVGIGFILALFTCMLVSILFFYHVGLICQNETTIEALRDTTFKEDNVTFDLGKWHNFVEVFGDNMCCWFVPIHSAKSNGYEFHLSHLLA